MKKKELEALVVSLKKSHEVETWFATASRRLIREEELFSIEKEKIKKTAYEEGFAAGYKKALEAK